MDILAHGRQAVRATRRCRATTHSVMQTWAQSKGSEEFSLRSDDMQGLWGRLWWQGETDTPDFRLAVTGRPVPLHTRFHAIVDGTSGNTFLQPVKARVLNSSFEARGSVVRTKGVPGHEIALDVSIDNAKIDDLLKLGVRTDPPIMTGGGSFEDEV